MKQENVRNTFRESVILWSMANIQNEQVCKYVVSTGQKVFQSGNKRCVTKLSHKAVTQKVEEKVQYIPYIKCK